MDSTSADPLSTQRNVILGMLLALAGAAWVALVWQSRGAEMNMAMDALIMGLSAPLFIAFWMLMMVAMMFPSAAPMILTYHKVQAGRGQRAGAFLATWVFVAGYLPTFSTSNERAMPAPRRGGSFGLNMPSAHA